MNFPYLDIACKCQLKKTKKQKNVLDRSVTILVRLFCQMLGPFTLCID